MPVRPIPNSTRAPAAVEFEWVKPLARPYLRGYQPVRETRGGLRGYLFRVRAQAAGTLGGQAARGARRRRPSTAEARSDAAGMLGFFVGFLTQAGPLDYLKPALPECLVYAFVLPVGGALHSRQVVATEGTLRWTAGYIRWLTHRPPRFEFFDHEPAALVRHCSMREWPAEKYQHFSGNFFIETLAWLVRSGLVRRWLELAAGSRPARPSARRAHGASRL
jgi:hypothetical protein